MSAGDVSRHTLWNVAGQVAPMVLAIIVLPILLHRLGLDRYGFVTLVWVLVGYVGVFDFGVGRAVTRVVAARLGDGDTSGAEGAARTAITFLLCVGCGLGLLTILCAPLIMRFISLPRELHSEGTNAIRILSLSLPLVLLTSGYRGYLEARRAFGLLNVIRIGMGAFTYLGPLIATFLSSRLESMVASVVVMRLLANYAHRRACLTLGGAELRFELPSVDRLRPLLSLGGWITISNIVSPLMSTLDRLLISPIVPIATIGIYATGYDVITKVQILAYSLTAAAFPFFASLASKERADALYVTFLKFMLLGLWPVLFLASLFASDLFGVWLGPHIAEVAGPVVKILSIGLLFNGLAQMPAMMIQSRGSPKWMAILHLCEMPIFLVAIYGLTSRFGVLGTAAAWTLRAAVDAIILFTIVGSRLCASAISWPLGTALFIAAPLMISVSLMDLSLESRAMLGAALITSFFAVVWFYLLNRAERARLLALLNMRFGRASA